VRTVAAAVRVCYSGGPGLEFFTSVGNVLTKIPPGFPRSLNTLIGLVPKATQNCVLEIPLKFSIQVLSVFFDVS
jgi:hypothetical protein